MQFSEKQLGELFINNYRHSDYLPFKKINKLKLRHETEKITSNETRADYVVYKKNRLLWVVEFKIVAEPSSIRQAYNYFNNFLYNDLCPQMHSIGKISIAAQFFKDDTIFFAEKLGVELIQISPINYNSAKINLITRHIIPFDLEKSKRRKGFKDSYEVLNG